MKNLWFNIIFAAILFTMYTYFWYWQLPGNTPRLTLIEVNHYLNIIGKLPFNANEKPEILNRIRKWSLDDDRKPIFMLNLMRFHETLRPTTKLPDKLKTPKAVNEYYERIVTPIGLKHGAFPIFTGDLPDSKTIGNLIGIETDADKWSRVLLIRFPSRRAFLEHLSDPEYAALLPIKLASLKLVLTPISGEIVMPDMRFFVGSLLMIIFLLVSWLRALFQLNKCEKSKGI
jgi:uncharacterized protein (DUF1330 family)